MRCHVVRIRPPDHVHGEAFTEMMEAVADGLQVLHHTVTVADNRWDPGALNIIFGAHHLAQGRIALSPLPPRRVVYNLEPLAGPLGQPGAPGMVRPPTRLGLQHPECRDPCDR